MGRRNVLNYSSLGTFCRVLIVVGGSAGSLTLSAEGGRQLSCQSPSINQLPLWASKINADKVFTRATNLHGNPLPSLTASQAIGTRGHLLLQDFHLMDKLASFARERVPERLVHAKGAGAHGLFEVTHDISQYTKASFMNGIGKRTPVFTRFSTAVGEKGTADTYSDFNGFATKFYTRDGNYDMVGFAIVPFPIRDPLLFADSVHSRKRNPVANLYDPNMAWDFASTRPESTLNTLNCR